jgi:TfoX/Sxy family transcriptional regulator of competence genes
MANDQDFVDFVIDQVEDGCEISYRHMFGGTSLYGNGKVVALICDNQLFVKPTDAGRAYIDRVVEAPPYSGARNAFLIEDEIEDAEWLTELIVITEKELPAPKPKKKHKKKESK